MSYFPLPEYAHETPEDRRKRFERYVARIKRDVIRGDRLRAVEFYFEVIQSRLVGAFHDEHVLPLVELIVRQYEGGNEKTDQENLFS